jgi:serine protease Do
LGIGTDIVKFFYLDNANKIQGKFFPRSLGDFLDCTDYQYIDKVTPIIQRLIAEGFLFRAGTPEDSSPMSETYFAFAFNQDDASYGVYDFLALGFPKIREHFAEAVRAVVVTKVNDAEDIGSGFLVESRMFVTARHCILNMKEVRIPGWNPSNTSLLNIWTPVDDRVDLAVLQFDGDPFPGIPGFQVGNATLLDDVLTMGYPPIPGFESVLVAETAQIAGHLKSTTGQVIGEEKSYLDQQTYLLISARVKGGNSGGPVIGRLGRVVGVVCQLPAEAEGRVDTLGYACAIPTKTLSQVLLACLNQSDSVESVKFKTTPHGFSTA